MRARAVRECRAATKATRLRIVLAMFAVASLATPISASGQRALALNGLSVQGKGERIEVFARAGNGGSDYFCAAADFARSHLNARATDRVVITSGLGPSQTRPGRRSVIFGLRPPGAGQERGLDLVFLRAGSEGTSRSVAHAASLCIRPQADEDD
ncbi:MAG: hypothetical protein AAF646_17920 [Pseudomonadota bacterium]